jgi:hypothetical protein
MVAFLTITKPSQRCGYPHFFGVYQLFLNEKFFGVAYLVYDLLVVWETKNSKK